MMPRPWLFWMTLVLAAAGLGVTMWRVSAFLNPVLVTTLLLMTAAIVSPWASARLKGPTQWSVSLGVLMVMWFGWLYFFDVLALFGPGAVFSTWWVVARRGRVAPRPRPWR